MEQGATSTPGGPGHRQASDRATLERHFGTAEDLVPLWIAEPDLSLAPAVTDALRARAATGWYGYETRPESVVESFWEWSATRRGWDGAGVRTLVSPGAGTSIGTVIARTTGPRDGVVIQPPVFTDFKPLVVAAGREVVRNALVLTDDGYRMDLDDLAARAADPSTRLLILCNPHNPVGRVWTRDELRAVAQVCAEHDVTVLADEIHADVVLSPHDVVPFAVAAEGTGVRWAAIHGPTKTFGLAGVCDTLLLTDDEEIAHAFGETSSQLHLTRNNVFGLAAFEAAYRHGGPWFDDTLGLVAANVELLRGILPEPIRVHPLEGTYLAWLDLRGLGLPVPEMGRWLGAAGVALSPGHWFGREGAGFARMTVAVPGERVEEAAQRIARHAAARSRSA